MNIIYFLIPAAIAYLTSNKFKADQLIRESKKYIGVPYVWGGCDPNGFDCSGFTQYAFKKIGVNLPRTVSQLYQDPTGEAIESGNERKGDLIIFYNHDTKQYHVGIVTENNKMIHAVSAGITENSYNTPYWNNLFVTFKRFI